MEYTVGDRIRVHQRWLNKEDNGWQANFSGEHLSRFRIKDVDLSYARFRNAVLDCVTFCNVCLKGADFTYANLNNTLFENTDLHNVELGKTSLIGTYFRNTNLSGTCLDPEILINSPSDKDLIFSGLELDEDSKGHKIVRGWRTKKSQHVNVWHIYTPGWHIAPYFSVDRGTKCHPGIYLASKKWLELEYEDIDGIFRKELVRCWCYRDEILQAGNKFRTPRLFVEE